MSLTKTLAPLPWRDMLDEIARMPREALTEDVLFSMVQRLVIDSCLLAPYILFNEASYSRNVLYRDEKFEAICLCWQPGQATAIHNHGRSFGLAYVHEGALAITTYRRLDDAQQAGHAELAPMVEVVANAGTLTMDRVGSIHRLGNSAQASRRAVSLHFYAGPLDVMEIFDLDAGTVVTKSLQAEPMAYFEPDSDAMAMMI